ncbi:MAG: DUF885 domain-containing protein [Myxococcaceae bacterium]|nr:DUF885 domain-containing protein [Myxococcaceae bacterium]MCI0673210.1 DUF885 domain-containing protein [Myxococcaceae bacterium]
MARRRAEAHPLEMTARLIAPLALLAACTTPSAVRPHARPSEDAAAQVRELADTYLAALRERSPEEATLDGVVEVQHDRLRDNSLAALERWHAREDAWLAQLARIDAAGLVGRPEWLSLGVMREALEGSVATRVCRFELWGVSHANGWPSMVSRLGSMQPVGSEALRVQALARWRALPAFIDVELGDLREGLRLGYSAPKGNVRLVIRQLDELLATAPEASPLFEPARRDATPAFREALVRVVDAEVLPAIRRYRAFLEAEYLPRAREPIGVSANPGGEACYRARIRAATGFDMTAEQLHRLGLETMSALEERMRRVAQQSFHTSDVGALLARLRTEPGFTFRSREEMLAHAEAAVARAKAAMPKWFRVLPRADVVVKPYPAFQERQSVGEWNPPAADGSRPGTYLLSTYAPEEKSRAETAPLTFHETIPGHHLQGALALEREAEIPAIVRAFWSPGFGEGWAEYAELLADEMGLYASDAERLGALADVTLSATLLVVDTGINAFGWTREQGIEYIRAHTQVPRLRAEVPVDRYPVWPAQGLPYALGRLEVERLRAEAERTLGAAFDIREFHDVVLDAGVIPLPLLRAKVERWVAARRPAEN